MPLADERETRSVRSLTLGEMFDQNAEILKALSDDQNRLSSQNWEKGPRVIRGVAGSGKTIVLASNIARRLERGLKQEQSLFDKSVKPRLLAVCFNRTVVPFLHKKISIAFQQRTGKPLPGDLVEVMNFNGLMYKLSKHGVFRYQRFEDTEDEKRAGVYLRDLLGYAKNYPEPMSECLYDAIYVDEGQDSCEDDYRILGELCRKVDGEPSLFIFYDDAQNLYGRNRPNWQALGLNVQGRSHVMTDCFRNTRQIVEPAFNLLYGSFAESKKNVPTKSYGDLTTSEDKKLLSQEEGRWLVKFAHPDGILAVSKTFETAKQEIAHLIDCIRCLVEDQDVCPRTF